MQSYIGPSGSFSHMKNLNLEKVFRTIVLKAPISRAEISRETGLNKVTVSNCIKDLLAADIVSEEGIVSAETGRPPMMLMLSKSFGVIIGVEVSGITTNIVVTDMRGTILEQPIREQEILGPDELVATLKALVKKCNTAYKTKKGVIGIGLAIPLNYNEQFEKEKANPLPAWSGVDAEQLMRKHFPDIPVAIMNTAAAGTFGEIHFGSADPDTYLAYIHGNWTLKMDVYDGGSSYSENGKFYGKLGNMIFSTRTEKGNKAESINDVAGVGTLITKFYPKSSSRFDAISKLIDRIKKNDAAVDNAVIDVVDNLAVCIYDVIQLFKPDAICVGGYLGYILSHGYINLLNEKVDEMIGPDNNRGRRITVPQLGLFNVAYGAVSLIRDNIIEYYFTEE